MKSQSEPRVSAPPSETLGDPAPGALVPWRLQLHWAAQIVAAVGHTFATPRPDDSHTSLTWDDRRSRFLGEPLRGTPIRAALDVHGLTLHAVDGRDGASLAAFPLGGRSLDEGYAGMATLLTEASKGALRGVLARRDYDMPDHPVAHGAPFAAEDRAGYEELARWYRSAEALLQWLRLGERDASEVRCWPHHFDIATLIPVPLRGGSGGGNIGVGMTPGDEAYGEPYWYVTPSPHADEPATPPLPSGGHWRTEGWFGAVLTGTAIVSAGTAVAQEKAASGFLSEAVGAARTIVLAAGAGAEEGGS